MLWLICTSTVTLRLRVSLTFHTTNNIADSITENKEAIEEKAGVDEVGAAAVETGYAGGAGEWEVSGAGAAAFAGASATPAAAGAGWDASGEDWAAAPAASTTAEWGAADATKTSEW